PPKRIVPGRLGRRPTPTRSTPTCGLRPGSRAIGGGTPAGGAGPHLQTCLAGRGRGRRPPRHGRGGRERVGRLAVHARHGPGSGPSGAKRPGAPLAAPRHLPGPDPLSLPLGARSPPRQVAGGRPVLWAARIGPRAVGTFRTGRGDRVQCCLTGG